MDGDTVDGGPADDAGPAADAGPAGDAGPAADTGPFTDAGPAADTGPFTDAGPAADAGPGGICDLPIDGTYPVTPAAGNPPICDRLSVTECMATKTDDTTVNLVCGSVAADCTLAADCTCNGAATLMGIPAMVMVDFAAGTVAATAIGNTCRFTFPVE